MHYDIAAKPTMYRGIMFRSKLEATWARYFDVMQWQWEYEPFYVNGWFPDFVLKGVKDLLVEVKPFICMDEFRDSGQLLKMHSGIKTKYGTTPPEILLLGNQPMWNSYLWQEEVRKNPWKREHEVSFLHYKDAYVMPGWLCDTSKEANFNENGMWFNHAKLGVATYCYSRYDFNHVTGGGLGRMLGHELDENVLFQDRIENPLHLWNRIKMNMREEKRRMA